MKALEEHEKQLVRSSSEKEPLTPINDNEIINEIQNLSKQIDFKNLVYYVKVESGPKNSVYS